MNGLGESGVALARAVAAEATALGVGDPGPKGADVVVCPPFTLLGEVARVLAGTPVALGAQNVHWEDKGAFTGEIAAPMLTSLGCRYVIVGHSERRQYFGETDESVGRRLAAALRHGLVPILCVGETWEEREAGRTRERVQAQLRGALAPAAGGAGAGTGTGAGAGAGGGAGGAEGWLGRELAVAYEPVWAIGTGRAARGADAQEVAALIRAVLAELIGPAAAAATRVLYGGSVKPENMAEFAAEPDIDGALVGGASLDAASFLGIVRQVLEC